MYSRQLAEQWKELMVGQDQAVEKIVPHIVRYKAGMTAPSHPIGNFFLLGPTGTGKTYTVETLAEVLHGDAKKMLKIDCAEYQMDHEVAKLLGAPPGYLGHRETQPLITQQKIAGLISEKCEIAIVLFDEIEKASAAFWRVLLGIMDKAALRLGDNSNVSFEKCMIFLSSNIGAKEMQDAITHPYGFDGPRATENKFEKIGAVQMNKKFPPEFSNRLDETITYNLLDETALTSITSLEIKKMQNIILNRLETRTFHLVYGKDVIEFLTKEGTSQIYGARELKRTINRLLWNPLADEFVDEKIKPGSHVFCRVKNTKIVWEIQEPKFIVKDDGSVLFNDIEVTALHGICTVCGKTASNKCENTQDCPYRML